jgi:ABC-type uncharacterized transport system permease subunit
VKRWFILGIILLIAVPTVSAQDNSNPGSFGLGATVSVKVDRATAQPATITPTEEANLLYIAAGFVFGFIVALLLMKLRGKRAITTSSGLGGDKHG